MFQRAVSRLGCSDMRRFRLWFELELDDRAKQALVLLVMQGMGIIVGLAFLGW